MQGHGRDRRDGAPLAPQERPPELVGAGTPRRRRGAVVIALRRGLAGLGVLRPVVALMQPRGEQPVQVGKRRARASAAGVGDLDLDQELVAAGTVPPFDLSPALRATRPTVGDLDVEDGGRPGQLPGGVRTAVVAVQVRGAAVGLDRVVQGSLHAQGVLAEAPPVADHEPGMVVEEGEQHRPSAVDERAVQPVLWGPAGYADRPCRFVGVERCPCVWGRHSHRLSRKAMIVSVGW